CSTFHRFDVW
nr:immunoglobulin heavy chain junction region [Macaca mulatta]MOY22739.1 immunoglobulin heavy chain junction region [Macaca mulatta]MOY23223.1 immunoglobulin heavy chain junction region [Macaca mulatta]MOY23350.1 immunoglobulin heavy chain junction region [Macaca mulatta]MOY23560.1 immunoglobulin heavy chain junction region [Macaca mulatta]